MSPQCAAHFDRWADDPITTARYDGVLTMRNGLVLLIASILCASGTHSLRVSAQTTASPIALVGTWTLVSVEQCDESGQVVSSVSNPRGLLVHDSVGHAIEISSRGGRPAYAQAVPTSDEARSAFDTYAGFFGTYRVDPSRSTITYSVEGDVNPNLVGRLETRSYARRDNQLVLTTATTTSTGSGTIRVTWDRVAELEALPQVQQRLVGFWQWVSEERINLKGEVIDATHRDSSVIVYTPTGHVAVHFLPADRKRFLHEKPTPDEAKAAITGYVSYFGPYLVQPERSYVNHYRLAVLASPGQVGDTLQRFFELSESELRLKLPPAMQNGQQVRNVVTTKRLSALPQMLSSLTSRP